MSTVAWVIGGILAVNFVGTIVLSVIYFVDERKWKRENSKRRRQAGRGPDRGWY